MWIDDLGPEDADGILGEYADEIVEMTEALASGRAVVPPPSLTTAEFEDAMARFGPNGASVLLFLKSWESVPWRSAEGTPTAKDSEVVRVDHWEKALNPTASARWKGALLEAGYQVKLGYLQSVWDEAFRIGMSVGQHHAKFLAAGSSGELAQMPKADHHFFLDLMPWIRAGHWPCGWDDEKGKPIVF